MLTVFAKEEEKKKSIGGSCLTSNENGGLLGELKDNLDAMLKRSTETKRSRGITQFVDAVESGVLGTRLSCRDLHFTFFSSYVFLNGSRGTLTGPRTRATCKTFSVTYSVYSVMSIHPMARVSLKPLDAKLYCPLAYLRRTRLIHCVIVCSDYDEPRPGLVFQLLAVIYHLHHPLPSLIL